MLLYMYMYMHVHTVSTSITVCGYIVVKDLMVMWKVVRVDCIKMVYLKMYLILFLR